MSIEVSALGRTRIAVEAAFATSEITSPANFLDLPVVEGSVGFKPAQEHLDPQVQQQFVHAFTNSKQILGKKSSSLTLATFLAGTGAPSTGKTATPAWLTGTTWPLYRLLSTLMGGVSQGTLQAAATKVVAAGSTASSINVTAGHGDPATGVARAGGAFACTMPNGTIEAREILSCTANNVVPKVAFSTTPSNDALVYWATTYHLIEGLAANLATLQVIVEGAEASDEWVALGCQGTIAIDVTTGQLAKLTAALTGASYARTTGTFALAAAGAATGFSPIANLSSELILGTGTITACQTRNLVSHASSSWAPGFAASPISSPEGPGSSGIIGWKRARGRAVTGSFVAYDDTAAVWETADSARTDLALFQQVGMTTAGIVLISAPTIEITSVPVRADASGLYAQTVEWAGRNDGAIASPTTDLMRSALRLHVF